MATTKKVAVKVGIKKRKAPKKAVSSVSKKTPKKKPTAKPTKTLKKTTVKKKVVKKPVKKNVVENKEVKKITQERQTSKKSKILPVLYTAPLTLVAMTVTRFPVNYDTFAIQTARIGGLMIVVMGAFYTLLLSQYIWGGATISNIQVNSSATTVCAMDTMTPEEYDLCMSTQHTLSGGETLVETTSSATVQEPPVSFAISGDEPLNGQVIIDFFVEYADSVHVLAFHESYSESVYLGLAKRVAIDKWRFAWDTTRLADGNYKIAVDVTNAYHDAANPYRDSDAKYLAVQNTSDNILVDTTDTTQVVIDQQPTADFKLHSTQPVVGDAHFSIDVPAAQEIKLYALHVDSGSENYIGNAYFETGTVWKFVWKTLNYKDGKYRVVAKIKNEFGAYAGDPVVLTLNNSTLLRAVDTNGADAPTVDENSSPIDTAQTTTQIPDTILKVQASGVLADLIDLRIDTVDASFVELYLIPEGSLIRKFLGLAKKVDTQRWVYRWDTTKTPNGKYRLLAKVKNSFGSQESNKEFAEVFNKQVPLELTHEQSTQDNDIELAKKIEEEIVNTEIRTISNDESSFSEASSDTDAQAVESVIDTYKEDISNELQRLVTAYRSSDSEAIDRAEVRLENLKKSILNSPIALNQSKELLSRIDQRIDEIVVKHKALSSEVETLIVQRVGEDVFRDSDSDGVSDYDERTLYKTNPNSADTDGDGFIDGLEIESGYDPLDSKREVAVVYESPLESGVVRDDVLSVDSIDSVEADSPNADTDGVPAQAVIRGKALPNSFVTLYIFSTPIVITVKTEADGSWQYRFDKELEDGEHNVYVGVTDNAGKIVAKSAPFTFVKEAQAFSPADASVVDGVIDAEQNNGRLLSEYTIYLVLSISVVSIGLVLILLGLHLDTRQRKVIPIINEDEVT